MRISTSLLVPVRLVLLLGMAGILIGSPAGAATGTTVTNPSQTFFAASATDLINAGRPTLASTTHTGYTEYAGSNTGALNDGIVGGETDQPSIAFDLDGVWMSTYYLNLTDAPDGYDLTEVRTIAAWIAKRASQRYELFVSLIGDSSFTSLGSFEYVFGNDGASQVTITDSTGVLAHGVDAVRFSVKIPGGGGLINAETAYREFDVFGNATVTVVPEPESYAMLLVGLGLLGFMARRRKQHAP